MKQRLLAGIAMAMVLAAGPAAAQSTIDYEAYVTSPVMAGDFSRLHDWSSPDPRHVVLWTSADRAYFVTLTGECPALEGATTIGVTGGRFTRVSRDSITIGRKTCLIQRIHRLDTPRLKAAMHAGD